MNFEVEKVNWALAIDSVKSVVLFKKNPLQLKLLIDKTINKTVVEQNSLKLKNKKERVFLFYSNGDLKRFLFCLRRLYLQVKKINLSISLS
jgi:hypothetical protein